MRGHVVRRASGDLKRLLNKDSSDYFKALQSFQRRNLWWNPRRLISHPLEIFLLAVRCACDPVNHRHRFIFSESCFIFSVDLKPLFQAAATLFLQLFRLPEQRTTFGSRPIALFVKLSALQRQDFPVCHKLLGHDRRRERRWQKSEREK